MHDLAELVIASNLWMYVKYLLPLEMLITGRIYVFHFQNHDICRIKLASKYKRPNLGAGWVAHW